MKLDVQGMTCGHCVKAVTAAIAALDPAARVRVDLATGRVDIDGGVDAAQAIAALRGEGYAAALAGPEPGNDVTAPGSGG